MTDRERNWSQRKFLRCLSAALFALLCDLRVAAQTASEKLQVNTSTAGDQCHRAIAMDSAGNSVVTLAGAGQNNNGFAIFGQHTVASPPPSICIADANIVQPDSDLTNGIVFPVTVSSASAESVMVDYTTANGTAASGTDSNDAYGTPTFNPGPLAINVNETISVSDAPDVLPSAMIAMAENIVVTDAPAVLPSAMVGVSENIAVTDAPQIFNTPAGTRITVLLLDLASRTSPVTLKFSNVVRSGGSTLMISSVGPPPPSGFVPGTPPRYYDVTTTAVFTGSAQVCISYAGIRFQGKPSLWHSQKGVWVNITVSVDTVNQVVCGNTKAFSPFALFGRHTERRLREKD